MGILLKINNSPVTSRPFLGPGDLSIPCGRVTPHAAGSPNCHPFCLVGWEGYELKHHFFAKALGLGMNPTEGIPLFYLKNGGVSWLPGYECPLTSGLSMFPLYIQWNCNWVSTLSAGMWANRFYILFLFLVSWCLLFTTWLWHGALAMWNSNLRMALYDQLGRQSFSSSGYECGTHNKLLSSVPMTMYGICTY